VAAAKMCANRHVCRPIFDAIVDQARIKSRQPVGIFSDFFCAFAHLGIAYVGEIDVVNLQVPATDGRQRRNFLAKNPHQISKELLDIWVDRLVYSATTSAKMNQRWRWDALLGSLFGHRGEKRKILRLDPVWMPELTSNHKLGRRALHVCACALEMARGVRQQAFDDFNTLKLAQK